ncbi:hypothetical protein AG1IA_06789 [Rhizoctonia solani AG-1 IA]|uniref:Uncharacterized protein n=1 Tax=Thanatephorus cucumeris (strain AG1-IA) TaxID=983506 RepID=L8WR09_THACA|nr:hypothetical protein AG1IA_06789 [Rhizoctonia solani AG-1 IA]
MIESMLIRNMFMPIPVRGEVVDTVLVGGLSVALAILEDGAVLGARYWERGTAD